MSAATVQLRNVTEREATCRCGKCGLRASDQILVCIQAFVYRLERKLGKRVRVLISSMARCPAHNKAEGGVKDSRHTTGQKIGDGRPDAADTKWQVDEGSDKWGFLPPDFVAHEAIQSGLFGGVGYRQYQVPWTDPNGKTHPGSQIVHLDCRPGPLKTW